MPIACGLLRLGVNLLPFVERIRRHQRRYLSASRKGGCSDYYLGLQKNVQNLRFFADDLACGTGQPSQRFDPHYPPVGPPLRCSAIAHKCPPWLISLILCAPCGDIITLHLSSRSSVSVPAGGGTADSQTTAVAR
jgi:hypothetical protein